MHRSLLTNGALDPEVSTRITREQINDLPLGSFEGVVHIVRTEEEVASMLERLNQADVIGFDTESRPSFRKGESYPPSILQFAMEEEVYLVQLRHLGGLKPALSILEAERPLKVGIALHEDVRRLQRQAKFRPGGFVELGDVTTELGIVNTGLRSLAGLLLGVRISKTSQVSNWNRSDLSEAQIRYAATDAWISLRIYDKLRSFDLI